MRLRGAKVVVTPSGAAFVEGGDPGIVMDRAAPGGFCA